MSTTIGEQFIGALASNDESRYELILRDDVGMRIWGARQSELYRPRARVIKRLIEEWSRWNDASIEMISIVTNGDRVALEYRIQATEEDRYVEHNRAAFFVIEQAQIKTIDTPNPSTVVMTLASPYVPFLSSLAISMSCFQAT